MVLIFNLSWPWAYGQFVLSTGFSEDCLWCLVSAYPARPDRDTYQLAKGMCVLVYQKEYNLKLNFVKNNTCIYNFWDLASDPKKHIQQHLPIAPLPLNVSLLPLQDAFWTATRVVVVPQSHPFEFSIPICHSFATWCMKIIIYFCHNPILNTQANCFFYSHEGRRCANLSKKSLSLPKVCDHG